MDGRKRASGRSGSYADLNSYILDVDNEDEEAGETGSIDQKFSLKSSDNERNVLRRGVYPLSVQFLNWQQSTVGQYIEFKIRVRCLEGP
jgi:hypothetical protein